MQAALTSHPAELVSLSVKLSWYRKNERKVKEGMVKVVLLEVQEDQN